MPDVCSAECPQGFPKNQICNMAEQGKNLELKCKTPGELIKKVVFASYGKHLTSAPGPCKEGERDTC